MNDLDSRSEIPKMPFIIDLKIQGSEPIIIYFNGKDEAFDFFKEVKSKIPGFNESLEILCLHSNDEFKIENEVIAMGILDQSLNKNKNYQALKLKYGTKKADFVIPIEEAIHLEISVKYKLCFRLIIIGNKLIEAKLNLEQGKKLVSKLIEDMKKEIKIYPLVSSYELIESWDEFLEFKKQDHVFTAVIVEDKFIDDVMKLFEEFDSLLVWGSSEAAKKIVNDNKKKYKKIKGILLDKSIFMVKHFKDDIKLKLLDKTN